MEDKFNKQVVDAADTKSGVAVDIADNEAVSPEMVKDYLHELNNNHAGDNDFDANP